MVKVRLSSLLLSTPVDCWLWGEGSRANSPNLARLLNCSWTCFVSSDFHGKFCLWLYHAYDALGLRSIVIALGGNLWYGLSPHNATEPQHCLYFLGMEMIGRVVTTGAATSPLFPSPLPTNFCELSYDTIITISSHNEHLEPRIMVQTRHKTRSTLAIEMPTMGTPEVVTTGQFINPMRMHRVWVDSLH